MIYIYTGVRQNKGNALYEYVNVMCFHYFVPHLYLSDIYIPSLNNTLKIYILMISTFNT